MAVWNYENAAHLLKRAGFGAPPDKIQDFLDDFASVEEAVDSMLSFKGKKSKPPAKKDDSTASLRSMQRWWIKRMVKSKRPSDAAREKFVLFLHDHLVSGADKFDEYRWLSYQNRLFRNIGGGSFKTLMREFNRDPANLIYLDGIINRKNNINENWGREVMELFCLGVFQIGDDGAPDPAKENYSESDVQNLARASSGWVGEFQNNKGQYIGVFEIGEYDADNNPGNPAPIELFDDGIGGFAYSGQNLRFDEGVADTVDDALKYIFEKTDDGGNNQVGMFLASKLWTWYAFPPPSVDFAALGSAHANMKAMFATFALEFVNAGFEIKSLIRAILTSDEFYSAEAKSRTVKSPAEYVVQMLRAFSVKTNGKNVGDSNDLGRVLDDMGMRLFEPPNVAGWPGGLAWINAGTLLERMDFAKDFGGSDFGSSRLRFKKMSKIAPLLGNAAVVVTDVVDAVIEQGGFDLGPVPLSTVQRDALINYAGDGNPAATLDLSSEFTGDVETKVRGLISLLYQTAESQVH